MNWKLATGTYLNNSPVPSCVLDHDSQSTGRPSLQSLGPLDRQHPLGREISIQSNLIEIRAVKPVQIHVHQGQPSAAVFVDEGESGTGDLRRVNPQTFGQPADEGGLASPEIATKENDGVGRQVGGKVAGHLTCLFF